jgi:alpha-tubulin suppressor-like RCC1 family protein
VTARAANGRLSILSFVDVWAGGFWTIAKVNGSGDIYACGSNNYGQLGVEMNGLTDEEENDVVDGGTECMITVYDRFVYILYF